MTSRLHLAPTRLVLAMAAIAALLQAPSPASAATDGRLRVEILVDGVPVREYHARGTTYVEARRGHEYAIRLTNLEPVRVAVALAVDGRNTIDARRTSARDARKWILEPWQSQTIRGWQVDGSHARRFFFTTEDRSYADWLGDTRNVGVIEAVAFRERVPEARIGGGEPWRRPASPGGSDRSDRDADGRWGREKSARAEVEAPASAPESDATLGGSSPGVARAERRRPSSDEAATGMGRDVDSGVVRVDFAHEDWAASTVRVRYEYHEALEELGVLPRDRRDEEWWPWRRRERSTGFEGDAWCPEPRR